MLENSTVAQNIESVRAQIDRVCRVCGRKDRPVLLAATKTVPVEQINFTVRECGITDIGENRVQELLEKYPLLDKRVRLHFIGRLQRNKVKYIVDKVCLIHSADSLPLIYEIEKQAAKIQKRMDVLLEVNAGREEQKGGFFPEEVERAAEQIGALEHVHVCGLMAVAPAYPKQEDVFRCFEEISKIFIDISQKNLHNIDMYTLSMGMSDSMDCAIAAGSTMVRIGSALFGKREYKKSE